MLTASLAVDALALLGVGAASMAVPDWLWTVAFTGSTRNPSVLVVAAASHIARLFGLFMTLVGFAFVLAAVYREQLLFRRAAATLMLAVCSFSILFDLWLLVDESLSPWTHLGFHACLLVLNVTGLIADLLHDGAAVRNATNVSNKAGPRVDALLSINDAEPISVDSVEYEPLGDDSLEPAKSLEDSLPGAEQYGWTRLLQLASSEKLVLIAGCVALLIRLPFSLAVPHFVSECIGAVIAGDHHLATWSITALAVAGTIDAILDFFNFYLFGFAQQRIIKDLRVGLFRNLLRQELSMFDSTTVGFLTSRLSSDTSEMSNNLTYVFRFSIESVVRIGGIATYMFLREWRLALAACVAIPIIAVVNRYYGRFLHDNAALVQTALADLNSVAQEVLGSVRTVFAFSNEQYETDRFQDKVNTLYRLNLKQLFLQSVYYMVIATFLVNCVVQAGLLAYGSHLVFIGQMETSALIAFMLYQGQLQGCCQNLFDSFNSLIKSSGAGAKVFALLDRQPHQKSVAEPIWPSAPVMPASPRSPRVKVSSPASGARSTVVVAPASRPSALPFGACRGRITVSDVWFRYASRPHQPVLSGVSFDVQPGQVVALVGPSGSGKSTIFHLLENFYQPQRGRVQLDGVDIHALDRRYLHSVLGIVSQEPVLFAGTIEDNILYGAHALMQALDDAPTAVRPAASQSQAVSQPSPFSLWGAANVDECVSQQRLQRVRARFGARMVEAARVANAHDFITALPDGYRTEVGERGVQLSGGQKQRIAIARAILLDPRCLLLDEATSALDAQSESAVQAALEQAMRGRTTLVIAHRLSTIRGADRIVVFDRGRVVEQGTHAELLSNAAPADDRVTYRALVARQMSAAASDAVKSA